MGRLGNALLAGGVFIGVFAACWWLIPALSADAGPKPQAEPVLEPAVPVAPAGGRVPDKLRKAKAPSSAAEARDAALTSTAQDVAIYSRLHGVRFPDGVVERAASHAPPSAAYVKYAVVERGGRARYACIARLGRGGPEQSALPLGGGEEIGGQALTYIVSGCAEAMEAKGRTLLPRQALIELQKVATPMEISAADLESDVSRLRRR